MDVLEIAQWKLMPCLGYTLQLVVEVVLKLPKVSHTLATCRYFLVHFNHFTKLTYLLKQKMYISITSFSTTFQHSLELSILYGRTFTIPAAASMCHPTRVTQRWPDVIWCITHHIRIVCQGYEPLVYIIEAIGAEISETITVVHPLLHKLLEVYFKPKEIGNITRLKRQQRLPCT